MSLSPLLLCHVGRRRALGPVRSRLLLTACRHLGRHPERHEALHWGRPNGTVGDVECIIVPHAVYRLAKPESPRVRPIQGVTGGRSGERVQRPGSLTL